MFAGAWYKVWEIKVILNPKDVIQSHYIMDIKMHFLEVTDVQNVNYLHSLTQMKVCAVLHAAAVLCAHVHSRSPSCDLQ